MYWERYLKVVEFLHLLNEFWEGRERERDGDRENLSEKNINNYYFSGGFIPPGWAGGVGV